MIIKQYENRQMWMKVIRTEAQTEENISSRPMTDADSSIFNINEYVDIDMRNVDTKPMDNNTITKTVSMDMSLNDNYQSNHNQNEKLFASKQHGYGSNVNESRQQSVSVGNGIPDVSFNITVKRS